MAVLSSLPDSAIPPAPLLAASMIVPPAATEKLGEEMAIALAEAALLRRVVLAADTGAAADNAWVVLKLRLPVAVKFPSAAMALPAWPRSAPPIVPVLASVPAVILPALWLTAPAPASCSVPLAPASIVPASAVPPVAVSVMVPGALRVSAPVAAKLSARPAALPASAMPVALMLPVTSSKAALVTETAPVVARLPMPAMVLAALSSVTGPVMPPAPETRFLAASTPAVWVMPLAAVLSSSVDVVKVPVVSTTPVAAFSRSNGALVAVSRSARRVMPAAWAVRLIWSALNAAKSP